MLTIKIYQVLPQWSKTSFSEREDKFDFTPNNLDNFLQALDGIFHENGWDYAVIVIA